MEASRHFVCGIFWSPSLGCKSVFKLHGGHASTGTPLPSPRTGDSVHKDTWLCAPVCTHPGFSAEAKMLVTTGHQEITLSLFFHPLSCPYCSIEKKNKYEILRWLQILSPSGMTVCVSRDSSPTSHSRWIPIHICCPGLGGQLVFLVSRVRTWVPWSQGSS